MKLIYAIVNHDDSNAVSSALAKEGFYSTRLASTGIFLLASNVTFISAVEDTQVDKAIEIIKKHSKKRTEVLPATSTYGMGLASPLPMEVTVGGATIFITNIERFEKV